MGVVHGYPGPPRPPAQHLHAAGGRPASAQRLTCFGERHVPTQQYTQRQQQILRIEVAHQGRIEQGFVRDHCIHKRPFDPNGQAIQGRFQDRPPKFTPVAQADLDALDRIGQLTRQCPAEGIVHEDHRAAQFRPLEQPGLGGPVAVHVPVVVEVIASEIGEYGGIQCQSGYPTLCKCVGGHLHRDKIRLERTQRTVQRQAIRGGQGLRLQIRRNPGAHRAQVTAGRSAQGQCLSHKICHGALAVGPGDPGQSWGGM